ncbi:DUF2789 family protein [Vibrio sp. 10N.261.55.A7]|uniref:DUF2789 family protein n=1 Tax=Vibrio sp. 10N.261.55.A7 TaxID=1880851 RepID=UPI000C836ADD|nr:DUF2789 family protein [Vibrio sp. 10N.261.55.A7]PMJ93415.1 hypothetical protein BCU12_05560 [Vibrio sp. 10N.261.55.A7]
MEMHQHSITELFNQLGLGSSKIEIQDFIAEHNGMTAGQVIHEAAFWSKSQADFLKVAVEEDADWAEVVGQLDALLHH